MWWIYQCLTNVQHRVRRRSLGPLVRASVLASHVVIFQSTMLEFRSWIYFIFCWETFCALLHLKISIFFPWHDIPWYIHLTWTSWLTTLPNITQILSIMFAQYSDSSHDIVVHLNVCIIHHNTYFNSSFFCIILHITWLVAISTICVISSIRYHDLHCIGYYEYIYHFSSYSSHLHITNPILLRFSKVVLIIFLISHNLSGLY